MIKNAETNELKEHYHKETKELCVIKTVLKKRKNIAYCHIQQQQTKTLKNKLTNDLLTPQI